MHDRRQAKSCYTKPGIPEGRLGLAMSNVVYPKTHAEGHCQTMIARRRS
jgi:hypothetical protein